MPRTGSIECTIFRNGTLYSSFVNDELCYRTDFFHEEGLENITIHVNGEFFREYDFTKPETKTNILMHSTWTDAPQR